jgi:hypothetical protein
VARRSAARGRSEIQRQAAETPAHDVGDAPAVGVAQQHQRVAEPLRLLDHPALLAHADRRGRAGQRGRVDADQADRAPVHAAEPGDHPVAGHLLPGAPFRLRQHAGLEPGALVEEQRDPLAHRQPAGPSVPVHRLLAAHLERLGVPPPRLGDALAHGGPCAGQAHAHKLTYDR